METIDQFLLIVGVILIGIAGFLLLKHTQPLRWTRLTLPVTIWFAYLFFLVIPSIKIVISDAPPQGDLTLGLVLLGVLTIPLGILTANAVWRFYPEEIDKFYSADLPAILSWERKRLIILTGIAIFFSILFFLETGVPPIFQAFLHPGEYDFLAHLRESVTATLPSPFNYIYFILRQFGWAFILSCWLGAASTERWSIKQWIGLAVVFVFALVYCSATLTRSPPAVLFIVIFLFYYLLRKGRMPFRVMLLAPILIFAIPIVVLFLHDPSRSWESIWIGLEERIFYAPAKLNFEYIRIFPEQIDFLYGRGIGKLASIGGLFYPGYEYFPISQEVYRRLFPDLPYQGNAPAPFVGTAYANWGLVGPPLYGLLIGFILQSVQVWLLRQPKNVFVLATQAVLFYSFFEINRTDFFACMLSYGGLLLPIGLVFLRTRWNVFKGGEVSWRNAVSG
ncbi:MAG TPA: O-antigen polymerase [Thermoguttaceae bacterium]|nr:O-antigen polymerase [Thermoguttaceae bacterium]